MRIFIGVEVSDGDLRQSLTAWQHRSESFLSERWRMTKPDNLHLTLRFLGQVEEHRIHEIAENLPGWVSEDKEISVESTTLKLLPSDEKVRVVALAFVNDPSLQLMVDKINGGLNCLGFEKPDLPFLPHVSLARHKGKPLKEFDVQEISWPQDVSVRLNICAVTIFSSESSDNGVVYRPLFSHPL
ncbi:RNA 2',3'-cyclic phosphodiesterase [Hydrogenovibrio kuenenii]|uniref:RNA 2',3'-cyclic phosphodiesterase n=1 Tax=Hydrogenovibrio kuenenii TaxID=63658 RepID=UPI000464F11B|nr:RNA 2',3'-cyclic phosphodiesterase [Hydrogenovibrio kuenenii]